MPFIWHKIAPAMPQTAQPLPLQTFNITGDNVRTANSVTKNHIGDAPLLTPPYNKVDLNGVRT